MQRQLRALACRLAEPNHLADACAREPAEAPSQISYDSLNADSSSAFVHLAAAFTVRDPAPVTSEQSPA